MKFQSPSTSQVFHDESNLLVEFLMLNKYGVLDSFSWRKGQPLAKEWGQTCQIVRRLLKTLKIAPERLGWYIRHHKITELVYAEFGLVKWKINKYFPFGNLAKTAEAYRVELQQARQNVIADRALEGVVYRTKDSSNCKRKKTLLDVLEELEHGEK
jgi:hypothetical protein